MFHSATSSIEYRFLFLLTIDLSLNSKGRFFTLIIKLVKTTEKVNFLGFFLHGKIKPNFEIYMGLPSKYGKKKWIESTFSPLPPELRLKWCLIEL